MSTEPRATYRVQLHAGFDLHAAAALVPYLAALGVSHVYCSPVLSAVPGSTHGYDVVNPRRVNPELGGDAGFTALVDAARANGLAILLDVVPNHMAIAPENPWWWDVLENGPASRYAAHFDVDWDPPESRLKNRVLLPVLGDHSGREIAHGTLRLVREGADFVVGYHERRFPIAPRSLDDLVRGAAARTHSELLAFLADAFGELPLATAADHESRTRRHRDKEVLRGLLARVLVEDRDATHAIDEEVAAINADPARLDALLERQNYRLAYWRAADRDLGYRRFFDIDTLVGLRAEDPQVFDETHRLVLDWVEAGAVEGLRIDHPDGLRDPAGYCARLRAAAEGAWIVVEKILEPGEALRSAWPVDGTTGYDFGWKVGGLFVDPAGETPLTALYEELTARSVAWPALVREKKLLACRDLLGSDVNRLAALFLEVCERHPEQRDHTRHVVTDLLREVVAAFPVYRSYVRAESGEVAPEDAAAVETATAAARAARPDLDGPLFDFFRDLLLLRVRGPLETELVMRFQQLTGPAMAKGVEDTAFYAWSRFVALNEVGGDPSRFGVPAADFHAAAEATQRRWPRTLLATSTHDTKRSEDVRARLFVLSEMPDAWAAAVRRWRDRCAPHRTNGAPDGDAEYLFYQTVVGAWPLDVDRAWAYMEKAAREGKEQTAWTRPDEAYERALRGFVEGALGDPEFTEDVARFVAGTVGPARVNALAQLLLKLTAPGVPDVYQGTELWDLSLVDPDNRRPVDFDARRARLAAVSEMPAEHAWARADEGLPKLLVLARTLAFRRAQPALFGVDGGYRALAAEGAAAAHVVAFARGETAASIASAGSKSIAPDGATTTAPRATAAVTVVPRLVVGLERGGGWRDTTLALAPGRWRNVLTGDVVDGGRVSLADVLARFPVALLARVESA